MRTEFLVVGRATMPTRRSSTTPTARRRGIRWQTCRHSHVRRWRDKLQSAVIRPTRTLPRLARDQMCLDEPELFKTSCGTPARSDAWRCQDMFPLIITLDEVEAGQTSTE